MNKSETHQALVTEIMRVCGALPNCRIWRNNTGTGRSMDGKRVLRFGLKGSADITGIGKGGRRIEIECKTGNATQNGQQVAFQNMIESFGGLYLIAHAKDLESVPAQALMIRELIMNFVGVDYGLA